MKQPASASLSDEQGGFTKTPPLGVENVEKPTSLKTRRKATQTSKDRIKSDAPRNLGTGNGPALWVTLGGLISMVIGTQAMGLGYSGPCRGACARRYMHTIKCTRFVPIGGPLVTGLSQPCPIWTHALHRRGRARPIFERLKFDGFRFIYTPEPSSVRVAIALEGSGAALSRGARSISATARADKTRLFCAINPKGRRSPRCALRNEYDPD